MARGRGGNSRGFGSRGRGTGGRGRGAGVRGRGAGGRGRGRSTSRWGPNRQFESARLDQQEESDSGSEESDSGDEEPSSEEEETSDKDDEDEATVKPYMALLQGFSDTTAAPSAKRRKLGHDLSASDPQPAAAEEPEAADGGEDLDAVEGGDDDLDAAVDEQPEDDSEDDEDLSDPFDQHFAHPDEKTYSSLVKAAKDGNWTESQKMVGPWRATFQHAEANLTAPPAAADLGSFKLKQKLAESAKKRMSKFGDVEKNMGPLLFGYRDILHCDRTVRNAKSMRQLVCLHALNHVMKTRDRVIKDNYKLAKDGNNPDLEFRDQGFTRPKVLFLSPTRNSCAQIVNIIRDLTEPDQQENRKRFDDSYIDTGNRFGDDKPEDFKHLFEGNDDDMFRLGLKFTRKTIKYFSQFYNSDILLASPLGLRMAIGSEEEKNKKNKLDYDFLSSIELVVVDQADALLMQNWEHVEYIFEHLNLQPTDSHDCDFSRVRSWYLEDWARHFRQTVILSAFNTPDLTGLFREHAQNWAGKVRLQPVYPGVLQQLGVKAKQTFSRFQPPSVADDPDARFKYFTSTVIPSLTKRAKDATGTLIFIPSYLDFVRVRNYFAGAQETSNVSFGAISEYADVPEASRARSHFLSGRHRVLLYTERAHHFRRYQLNGVQRVIFYSLPDNHAFYQEIAGGYLAKSEQDMRLEPGRGSVRVLFSKYDAMRLERIVGSSRVGKMLKERGDTFDFV